MLGDNIKRYRTSRGMTQEELAVRLNVIRQTVSKWECGLSVPDAEMLERLAAALDADVVSLLGDREAEPSPMQMSTAEQLARINEQLAVKNRRARRLIIVGVIAGAILLLSLLSIIVSAVVNRTYTVERDKADVYTYKLETVED